MLYTPTIMSVNGIYTGEFVRQVFRYKVTRFTVLNINDFICLSRLSARLFHLRARRI